MDMVRRSTITLSSYNRLSGSVSEALFSFPPVTGNRAQGSKVFVSPTQFMAIRNWFMIDSANNFFYVSVTPAVMDEDGQEQMDPDAILITVPPGNYNPYSFMAELQVAFDIAYYQGAWEIGLDINQNKFTFIPPDNGITYYFRILNWIASQLGFAECGPHTDHHRTSFEEPLTSEVPIMMVHEKALLVRSSLPFVPGSSMNNLGPGGVVQDGSVLLTIPLGNVACYDMVMWEKSDANISKWALADNADIQTVTFSFSDEFLKPLQLTTSWMISMDVEVHEPTPVSMILKELTMSREFLNYLALHKMDKENQDRPQIPDAAARNFIRE